MTATPKQPQDHLRSRKKPMAKTVRFIGDPEAMDRLEEARRELQSLKSMAEARSMEVDGAELARLQENIDAAQAEVDDSIIKIRFQGLGRKAYEQLQRAHPPTEEQKAEGDEETGPVTFNPETYPIALITACAAEVWVGGKVQEFSAPEDKQAFLDSDVWNQAEFWEMWMTCLHVNQTRKIGDLGKD